MRVEVGGFFGILLLIGIVYAVLNVVQSHASLTMKAVWIAALLMLPLLGLIAWFFFGPREAKKGL
ncbi:MAG: PLDc N-terminal domain-containing protein [Oleibacter sp.]|nr:PLDc N-terminal domain-containing protein [Thalassolituus sp.]